jgi:hypothetical protein
MTIVKAENYLAEKFAYLFFKNKSLSFIESEIYHFGAKKIIESYYKSLQSEIGPFKDTFFPNNLSDPSQNKQNALFDLEDETLGINVKYQFDLSANSRIRDLTKELVLDLNSLFLSSGVINKQELLDYYNLRNVVFRRIGNEVKNNQKITINQNEELYIKCSYLICLNLMTFSKKEKEIFFVKFHSKGFLSLFHAYSPKRKFDLEHFLTNSFITFSSNKPLDPHKKTIQVHLKNKFKTLPIGFFEVRSNGRVMLHLREGENHWMNLTNNIKFL